MKMTRKFATLLLCCCICAAASAEDSLKAVFEQGSVSGNIRAYYNTRSYETREDEGAFALGGALRAETGSMGLIKLGVGYYTAQDLGTNDDDPIKVNNRLGSDLEVLGEAYINIATEQNNLTLGRQIINSPFANAGDAFIIPFTFQGYSFVSTSIRGLTLQADYLNEIKNRNSDEFVDVGQWNSGRYGLTTPTNTSGTLNLGAVYGSGPFKVEAWFTQFSEFFDSLYFRGDYQFNLGENIKPFMGLQYATQSESGDALLGIVDSTLFGVQLGAGFGKGKVTLAYNSVAEQEDAYQNGAFLAPYSFSTSPIFTNNMLQTVENVDAGDASKITFNYTLFDNVAFKLSYATFDFDQAADRDATDVDITYSFDQYLKGLSLRWRVEVVTSDVDSVEQTNHRFQTQFVF